MKHFNKLASVLILGAVSQGANAYQYLTDTCGILDFNSGHMTFNFGSNLTQAQKDAHSFRIFPRTTAFSDTSFTISNSNDTSFSTSNGQNEIYHDSAIGTAQCWVSYFTASCVVAEADIRYGTEPWDTVEDSGHWPYNWATGGRSMIGTGVHEAGHCVGMGHENVMYNMMGSDWDHVTRNGNTTYYGPGEDMSNGIIALHGERSASDTYRDVGATVFRYSHVSGQYSAHKWGVLRNSSGSVLPVVGSFSGQNMYEVTPGQAIQFEMTLENNGEQGTENPNVGFYLSGNSIISAGDTLVLNTTGWTLGRNTPFETTRNLTIPSNTAPGDYFLGAFVDHDNLIAETTGANNIAYYPVRVSAPDLIVQSPAVSDNTLYQGQVFTASATVRNQGNETSNSTTLRYYRSFNSIISTGDTQIGTDFVSSLAANGTSFESAGVVAPSDGTYWIGACVDSVTGENISNNQCSTGVQVTVSTPAPAATTGAATNITDVTATLNATVNPNGVPTTVYFDYIADGGTPQSILVGSIGSGTSSVPVSIGLTGLICETGYIFAVRAVSVGGETTGNAGLFETDTCVGC